VRLGDELSLDVRNSFKISSNDVVCHQGKRTIVKEETRIHARWAEERLGAEVGLFSAALYETEENLEGQSFN